YYPKNSTNYIIRAKSGISHRAYSGNKGSKRTYDRDKPRVYDGFTSMFIIKILCFIQVLLFKKFYLSAKSFRTDIFPNVIVDHIAQNTRRDQQHTHKINIQISF